MQRLAALESICQRLYSLDLKSTGPRKFVGFFMKNAISSLSAFPGAGGLRELTI
jgi:hypothetical protein